MGGGFPVRLLIDHEVAAAPDRKKSICLIGDPGLVDRYRRALAGTGFTVTMLNGERCALAGLELLGESH